MSKKIKTIFELKASYYCNMGCKFCIFSERKGVNRPLTKEQIFDLASKIAHKYPSVDCFIISGGEPTIRQDFWYIFDTLEKVLRPEEIVLHTNGVNLSSWRNIKKLAKKKTKIFISFHTLSSDTHFLFTRTKSFNVINKNLDKFIRGGLEVYANMVVMKPNQYEIEKIGQNLFQRGIVGVEFRFPFGTTTRRETFPWMIPDDYKSIAKQLFKVIDRYSNNLNIFIHPSVPCLIGLMNPDINASLMKKIYDQSELSIKNNKILFSDNVNYLFLDPRMRFIKEDLQQKALNKGEKIFKKLRKCSGCKFKAYCMGVPIEFF